MTGFCVILGRVWSDSDASLELLGVVLAMLSVEKRNNEGLQGGEGGLDFRVALDLAHLLPLGGAPIGKAWISVLIVICDQCGAGRGAYSTLRLALELC